ncbi:MAG: 50S ribosomal protein L4 [Spirochaetaceae bacterium]|jgi:large subunit ribosomal protein L4|nr:50S ribosomal protein L4 [Spirochaetaceae bacterium]
MKAKVYSIDGKEVKTLELSDAVFGLPINDDVIWYAINNELANKRQGNASTKDRGEVHGSNAKPYKQKGTGRARRGDKKSPLLVGGGVIFGPKPRDYSYSIPKKAKRLAMKTILSLKAQSETIKIIEDFTVDSGKTKEMVSILTKLNPVEKKAKPARTVLLYKGETVDTVTGLDDRDALLPGIRSNKRAGANIPWLSFLAHNRLRAHDLFYARSVVITESAANALNEFYAEEAAE